MTKFNHSKYTYAPRVWDKPYKGSGAHRWEIVGPVGAVHFSVTFWKEGEEPTCGLEFHHTSRWPGHAERFGGEAPHHLNCAVLGEPCWHDGTSLYAAETVWPSVRRHWEDGEHHLIFDALQHEYKLHFEHGS